MQKGRTAPRRDSVKDHENQGPEDGSAGAVPRDASDDRAHGAEKQGNRNVVGVASGQNQPGHDPEDRPTQYPDRHG